MEETSILVKVKKYLKGVKAHYHGQENDVFKFTNNTEYLGYNTQEVNYQIREELEDYLFDTRTHVKHKEIESLSNLLKDFILSIESKILINEAYIPKIPNKSAGEYIKESYHINSDLFENIKELYDLVEKEIDLRGKREHIKRQSRHCVDVVPGYTVALLEEILKNPTRINNLTKESKARILSAFTGFSKKSCQNWYSNPINKYEEEAIMFVDSLNSYQ